MTVVSRKVRSVPAQTASGTWHQIVDLLADKGTSAHTQLLSVAGVASMLIAEEYTRSAPIIVRPATGPLVRIYTLHGQAAVEEGDEVLPLPAKPTTATSWEVSLPCGEDDLDMATRALQGVASVNVRSLVGDAAAAAAAPPSASPPRPRANVTIDLSGGFE